MLNGVILKVFLKGKIGKALSVCARIKQECRFVELWPCFTSSIYCGIINKRIIVCWFKLMGGLPMNQALLSISII